MVCFGGAREILAPDLVVLEEPLRRSNRMERHLITTALEETWGKDQPVVFLGEWCRLYARKDRWAGLNAEVVPYHWNDREKLLRDYQYIYRLYDRLTDKVAQSLNGCHGVDHGARYWRIVVGPWLGHFIQVLFDRWAMIHEALRRDDLSGTSVLTGDEEQFIPGDMLDFTRMYIGQEWNHFVLSAVLENVAPRLCQRESRRRSLGSGERSAGHVSAKRRAGRILAEAFTWTAGRFSHDADVFLLDTYMPKLEEAMMHARLAQVPQLWRSERLARTPVDRSKRGWIVAGDPGESPFEMFVRTQIPYNLPTAYLEGYAGLVEQTRQVNWPKRPRAIWTSNAYSGDDLFKAWAAKKVEEGAKLVIGQHGGHYGTGLWNFVEDHEIAICDRYLTWGWTDPEQAKLVSTGQLTMKKPYRRRPIGNDAGALLVTFIVPPYSYWLASMPVGPQWLDYLEDQFAFVANLSEPIRGALTVRLHRNDYGWSQRSRWRDRFPGLATDDGVGSIDDLVRKCRVYIATYNATTFLESFTRDVPTVIFWDPKRWELRGSAIPFFDGLRKAGIFHESPESAARFVVSIWDHVEDWWASEEVRQALGRFKKQYANLTSDLPARIASALRGATDPTTGHHGV